MGYSCRGTKKDTSKSSSVPELLSGLLSSLGIGDTEGCADVELEAQVSELQVAEDSPGIEAVGFQGWSVYRVGREAL